MQSAAKSVARKVPFKWGILLSFLFIVSGMAQTVRFVPDAAARANLWKINDSTALYLGASFYYMNPSDSIIVWCDTSESDVTGELFAMVPGYTDSALSLFTNRDNGKRVNVTQLLDSIGVTVPVRTEFFFMYRFSTTSGSTDLVLDRFTGQNRPGIDPQDKVRYPGADFTTRDFGVSPGFGHRWAVAGRIREDDATITDTIVFGFEDGSYFIAPPNDSLMTSDFDFNDVIFRVKGLHLNVELIPDSLVLTVPATARAGDTVSCIAAVWADSAGTKFRTPGFDTLVHWEMTGSGVHHDTLTSVSDRDSLAMFIGKTAGATCRLNVWFVNILTGDTITQIRTIKVTPGIPAALSLELNADSSAPGFSRNYATPAGFIQIASNQLYRSVFALWRDRFGNFAGYSTATVWDTTSNGTGLTRGVAYVTKGDSLRGEGVVKKNSSDGSIMVIAADTVGTATLRDSVLVNIVPAAFDSLRLLVRTAPGDSSPAGQVKMSTDNCVDLMVQGWRADLATWQPVDVIWDYSSPWNKHDQSAAVSSMQYCPEDTGSGSLKLIYSDFLSQTIPLRVLPGIPVKLVLHHDGAPLPGDTAVQAAVALACESRLYDARGVLLSGDSLSSSLSWQIVENTVIIDTLDSTGSFTGMSGFSADYLPVKAHRTVKLTATWNTLSDTCQLTVKPGPAYRVVIEPQADWHRTPNRAEPVDTVEIADTRTTAVVYAILRDSLGNYVDSLRSGTWTSLDSVVSLSYGTPACRGQIVKNLTLREGLTRIAVFTSDSQLTDTAWVRLLPYHFVGLRTVGGAGGSVLDSLSMTTNDDTLLVAEGLRSDTAIWREVNVAWSASDSLLLSPVPPAAAARYGFFPQRAAQGTIAVALQDDSLFDTVTVAFTRGEPLWASVRLLTPEEKRIAGDTLRAVVKIYNRPGLLEGDYCFPQEAGGDSVYYIDSLGDGGRSQKPQAVIDGHTVPVVTPQNTGRGAAECFHEGLDTVAVILYYAPATGDSLHRLRFLGGDLNAATTPFRLLPAALVSMKLIHDGVAGDTLKLQAPTGAARITTIGYDRFGNVCGEVSSRWFFTGTLPAISDTSAASRIRYTSAGVDEDKLGTVRARAVEDTAVGASLPVFIRGLLAEAAAAVTRDTNGNGMLDRIDLSFSLPFTIRDTAKAAKSFTAEYAGSTLDIVRLTRGSGKNDIRLLLKEPASAPVRQTGWKPLFTFRNSLHAIDNVADTFAVICADGAGPVIWSVVKEMVSPGDRSSDRVTVVFSENVFGSDGQKLPLNSSPEKMFRVWTKKNTGEFDVVPQLKGITSLYAVETPDTLVFIMKNGNDLAGNNYVSIDTGASAGRQLIDAAGANHPPVNNQKVRVRVTGNPAGDLVVVPNPMKPTSVRENPGKISVAHNPSAKDWVLKDGAGTVVQFKIALPDSGKVTLSGRVTIYDLTGNRVAADPVAWVNPKGIFKSDETFVMNSDPRKNLLPAGWVPDGSVYEYDIYWNGYTLKGARAAPGVYKIVLQLVIGTSGGTKKMTFSSIIGVTK